MAETFDNFPHEGYKIFFKLFGLAAFFVDLGEVFDGFH